MPWQDVGMTYMLTAWLRDPQRRKQVLARILEAAIGVGTGIILAYVLPGAWKILAGPAGIAAEFIAFEFWLEPHTTWAGHFWERSAREGTRFITD